MRFKEWTEFWRSRPLKLSFSVLMLTMSVLFAADFFELRGDKAQVLREARKTIAEALAVQLSALASASDGAGIRYSVSSFVSRNQDVAAAALIDANNVEIAAYGATADLTPGRQRSSFQHITVPIFDGKEPWGEVQVVFVPRAKLAVEVRYFLFVLAGCFLLYLLFIRKALAQLDPSQAVPGRVHSAFDMLSEGVVILDDQLRILLVNESLASSMDKRAADMIGQQIDELPWEQSGEWQAPWATTLHTGLNIANQPVRLRLGDAEVNTYMVSCAAVGNEEDGMSGVLVTLDDMTAIEHKNRELAVTLRQLRKSQEAISRKNKELEALATQDPLTGLANRRALMENFERQFAKAARESRELSCVMVDIDHFKHINDTLGHAAGDEVICAVANTLFQTYREYDFVGRYGGEEFVVVLPDNGMQNALSIAERLRSAIAALADDPLVPASKLSASFGVATLDNRVENYMALLEHADQALYAAKQGGRNRVMAYDPKIVKLKPPEEEAEAAADITSQAPGAARVAELEAIVDERTRDLEMLRDFDALTGMPRRALFLQRIETEVQRAQRFQTKIGVLSMDLKELGRIVSSLGHSKSEALVVDVVARLQECLRTTDAVSEIAQKQSLSRIESNEFGVLLTDLNDVSNVMPVVTRLRRALSKPFLIGGQKVYVGVSIGVAMFPQSGEEPETLLKNANVARTKAATKPEKISHSFASTSMDDASRAYVQLEADLFDAVEQGAFDVHFQPIYDVVERRVSSMEALLRWRHEDRGYIPPDTFIGIAEGNGLIHKISEFVLARSLDQLAEWHGLGWTDLRVSVNISPMQIRKPTLAAELIKAVQKVGLPTEALEVELTETAVMESPQRARVVLTQLREAGIGVAMDDFGTGYSSLALLADLPLDSVKIDRSFIAAIDDSQRSRSIVESIINMAHALRLKVIGEGIETNDQLAALTTLGCEEIQGYLIARPMPSDQATEFLTSQGARQQPRKKRVV